LLITQGEFTRETGSGIKEKDVGLNYSSMAILTRESMSTEKLMVKESTSGTMEKSMTESGSMELRTDMEYGEEQKEILILVNGKLAKLMAMVFMCGRMATNMKESGKLV